MPTASASQARLSCKWNSSDQLAENAVPLVVSSARSTRLTRQFGALHLQRMASPGREFRTKIMAYGFTTISICFRFHLLPYGHQSRRPVRAAGQTLVGGLDARQTYSSQWFGRDVENHSACKSATTGLTTAFTRPKTAARGKIGHGHQWLPGGLFANGFPYTWLPADTDVNHLTDTQAGIYVETKCNGGKIPLGPGHAWRLGLLRRQEPDHPANSARPPIAAQPKMSLIFGPWKRRSSTRRVDSVFTATTARRDTNGGAGSADNPNPNTPVARIPGLIQTKARKSACAHWLSAFAKHLSLWYLHSESELEQDGDTGGTVASQQPSDRYGVEWATTTRQ